MEKTNVRRLIGVMMPFMIMVILQRLGILLLSTLGLPNYLSDNLAFVVASVVGIVFFRLSCGGETLRIFGRPTVADTATATDTGTSTDDTRRVPPFPPRDTALGRLLYTRVCVAGMILAMHIVARTAGTATASTELPIGIASPVAVTALVLAHPIFEEYIFRWLYYRELRPMQPIFAGLAQAILFAIVHSSVGGMVNALFAGVVLAFTLEHSGSLAVVIWSHTAVNLRSLVYMTILSDGGSFENAARIRTILDLILVALGFGAALALVVRRSLREVWSANANENANENDGEADTDTDTDTAKEDEV